jgi:hypothetical protein
MKRLFFVTSILMMLAGLVLPARAQSVGDEGLFTPAARPDSLAAPSNDPTILRSRYVTVDFEALGQFDRDGHAPGGTSGLSNRLVLNLFEDVTLVAILDRVEPLTSGRYAWVGHLESTELGQVVLIVDDSVVVGNITLPDAVYQIRYGGGQTHVIHQIDQAAFPPEGEPTPVQLPAIEPRGPDGAQDDDGSVIDVLVVYTAAASSGAIAGGFPDIEAQIDLAAVETNTSYANSQINQRIRVAPPIEVVYAESGSSKTDKARLQNPSDGFLDVVHEYRHAYGADLVTLLVENLDACGEAYDILNPVSTAFAPFAFNVTSRSCATGIYSFGHELGHLMGARHDWFVDATDNSPFTYNHAFINNSAASGRWRTVMAYNDQCDCSDEVTPCPALGARATPNSPSCTRLDFWSNPSVISRTVQMGSPTEDNHLTLNNTAGAVANFVSGSLSPVYVDGSWGGDENGSSANPFNTVAEAAYRTLPNAVVWIKPGVYPETLLTQDDPSFDLSFVINRPVVLRVNGSGTVVIGQ